MRLNGNEQETTNLAVKDAGLKATGEDIVGQAEVELPRELRQIRLYMAIFQLVSRLPAFIFYPLEHPAVPYSFLP
jgi:hypothetical protein